MQTHPHQDQLDAVARVRSGMGGALVPGARHPSVMRNDSGLEVFVQALPGAFLAGNPGRNFAPMSPRAGAQLQRGKLKCAEGEDFLCTVPWNHGQTPTPFPSRPTPALTAGSACGVLPSIRMLRLTLQLPGSPHVGVVWSVSRKTTGKPPILCGLFF